ncbi:response regulator transcription factor [uncultured Dubosiella sp.]|uniref:response regulator transcription factor n=1 Tax=uncultured Dubosiella sp. TaxID=1937011 RepID=UPI002604A1D1|nr:response regulator transcription factor [uncultured Dubosiella sp.]
MYKILVVEDDEIISREIVSFLKTWGYEARRVTHFDKVIETWMEYGPELVLMDISLPYKNGFYWTEKIRSYSKVPIIFISSANDNMNIVMAIARGADDFIAKPFDLQVLVAKIQAILRRTYDLSGKTDFLVHHDVQFSMNDNVVTYQGESVELTKNEGKIMRLLMEKKETIVSREELMEYLWKTDCYVDENALSVNVNRVRKKLASIGIENLIQTRKGIGYMIA